MKLFLSSLAISDPQSVELATLVGKEPKDIKLALIENAADTYADGKRDWVDQNRAAIQSHCQRPSPTRQVARFGYARGD